MSEIEKNNYRKLLQEGFGYQEEDFYKVNVEWFKELSAVGIVKSGLSGNWKLTWGLTAFGRSQVESILAIIDAGERRAS